MKNVLVGLMLLVMPAVCVSAQEEISDFKGEENYWLNFPGYGLRMIADGPETLVTNGKGQEATVAQLDSLWDGFEFEFPIVVHNARSANALVALLDKRTTTREMMSKIYTDYIFTGDIINGKERAMNVSFNMDKGGMLSSSYFVFGVQHKDDEMGARYVVKTLFDVRTLPLYAIIETVQTVPDGVAAVDSAATRNYFETGLILPEDALTRAQADSIGDGYDWLPVLLPMIAPKLDELGLKGIPSVESLLEQIATGYNRMVGHYPPSFEATHKEFVEREKANRARSVMNPNMFRPMNPMLNFNLKRPQLP